MKLVPYEPWHYEYLAAVSPNARYMGMENIRLYSVAFSYQGWAITIMHEGEVVGAAGVVRLWHGVGEAWTLFTELMHKYPLFIHKNALRLIRETIISDMYHRIQSTVCLRDPRAVRWIERLGFQKESIMQRFGADGSDYGMYVWSP
jgi:hypothetical protein